jgi:bestrophin-2/bestrophin-3
MTVLYASDLPPRFSSVGWWRKVVLRWTGGIYKLIGLEMGIFLGLWYIGWALASQGSFNTNHFDGYVASFRLYQGTVRTMLGFMLVYYYQEIYSRARRIFFAIPFPDSTFLAINATIGQADERGRVLKQTIFRYILATSFLLYHATSKMMQRKYREPWKTMVHLGLLTEEEVQRIRERVRDYPYPGEVSFVPLAWATLTIRQAFDDDQVVPKAKNNTYPFTVNTALKALQDYRSQCGSLLFEVYFPFPLLLSQLVTLVVYSYFLVSLVSQQNLSSEPTFIFPVFTAMEFIVYMGALRVGQTFTQPLGEDDNSFEIVAFFTRGLRLAHLYGAYGSSKHDFLANPLPVVDLGDIQDKITAKLPLYFYRSDVARKPVDSCSQHVSKIDSLAIPLL